MKFITPLLLTIFLFPLATTHAYKTTMQTAFSADQKTGVYLIEFTLGHASHDILVPIQATQGAETKDTAVAYSFLDTDNESEKGTGVGMVVSAAPVSDGMYQVPAGTRHTFTLVTSFTPDQIKTDSKYRLQVNHLPFNFDGTQPLSLNPSELKYYTTEYMQLIK